MRQIAAKSREQSNQFAAFNCMITSLIRLIQNRL